MKRITGSLVVCVSAGVFTAGALFYEPDRPVVQVPATPGAAVRLTIDGFEFGSAPAARGATVQVVNQDGASHTVTAESGAFNVPVDGGTAVTFTAPTAPGSYAYFCAIHPEMSGTLIVR